MSLQTSKKLHGFCHDHTSFPVGVSQWNSSNDMPSAEFQDFDAPKTGQTDPPKV